MISDFYTKTGYVYPITETDDGSGAIEDVLGSPGDAFDCKLDLLSMSEIVRDEKGTILADYRLFCPTGTVAVGTANREQIKIDSNYYDIYFIDDTLTLGNNPHLEVLLNLRK